MTPGRTRRSAVTLIATLGLLLGMVAMPATTVAKTPNWDLPESKVVSLPATVPAGSTAGYEVSLKNGGPSNISSLYLFTTEDRVPVWISDRTHCNVGQPTIPTTRLDCSFGALRKNQVASVTVAYMTPSGTSTDFTVNFEWNTTGLGSGSGDNSHGDALLRAGTTHLNANLQDFAGGFLVPDDNEEMLIIANDQAIGPGNKQASILFAPQFGIAATVGDGTPGVCPTGFSCFGEATSLVVGDGSDAYGIFKLIVKVYSSEVGPGVTAANLGVVHILDDGTIEDITTECPPSGNPNSPCRSVVFVDSTSPTMAVAHSGGDDDDCDDNDHDRYWSWIDWRWHDRDDDDDCTPPQDMVVTIYLDQNGYVKFH